MPVGLWPLSWHLGAALVLTALSFCSAQLLAAETDAAAWPLLDSLTTWFSLLATWLAARAKLENWLYWIAIDGVLVFLFYVQDLPFLALLNVLFIGIAAGGFVAWRRRFQRAGGARMIAGTLLQHVPGCEDGEPPYSQELIGGGKVNRSFLVRTRRGRFVRAPQRERGVGSRASIASANSRCTPRRPAPASRRRWSTPRPTAPA